MKPSLHHRQHDADRQVGTAGRVRGSVLIIVLWVAFGLVSIALYFAHSMTFELRASDNRVAGLEAEQVIEGASRYVNYVLTTYATNGAVPDRINYQHEAVPVGDARFWLIGRPDRQTTVNEPFFGLVDEGSKLNLNTATIEMLQLLPNMTASLAAAIIDWRDADSTITTGGAEAESYARLPQPYLCKNAPFETVDELRLVYGMTLELLYGEDANLNGTLDPNENDGPTSPPNDDRNGQLTAGILDYVTVYSREPNTGRTNITSQPPQQFTSLLQQTLGYTQIKANQVAARGQASRSVLEFYYNVRQLMTADEFARIEPSITASTGNFVDGRVNVNTASVEVLTCVPGIGADKAQSLVAYRQSNPDKLHSIAWVADVLDSVSAIRSAGTNLTTRSYQFSADIAAIGHHGRGYSRARYVFDTSEGATRIRYRQDLTRLGWALGRQARLSLLADNRITR